VLCTAAAYFSANGQPDNTHDDGKADEEMLPNPSPSKTRPIITRTKITAEQRWRMWEFAHRFGWSIQKVRADAVDALCDQVGLPKRVLSNWMVNNRHLAEVPPPSSPPPRSKTKITAEQRWRMWEFAHRFGWSIQKARADAVDALCAQVGLPKRVLSNWMVNNRHLAKVPPPSLPSPPPPSHHKVQDHPPAATPPQGSVTEQGKPPEPEAAAHAPADDGAGKQDEDEEASEAATQRGRGHRARQPSKRYADSFF
jgi:ZF-HD class homeobox domain-containing protein